MTTPRTLTFGVIVVMAFLTIASLGTGCRKEAQPPPNLAAYQRLPRLLILPVESLTSEGSGAQTICPICAEKHSGKGLTVEEREKFAAVLRSEFERSYRLAGLLAKLPRMPPPMS